MRRLFLILAILSAAAMAQNFRTDNVALGPKGPIPNALVAFCSQPANVSTTPCSPLLSLCSSITDVTCSQPNPVTADALGNYHAYVKTANVPFTVQIFGPAVASPLVLVDQGTGGVGGGGGSPGGPSGSVQGNNTGAFGAIPNASYNLSTGAITTTAPFSATGGGTFSGTFGGSPTATGTWTFNAMPILTPAFQGQPLTVGFPIQRLFSSPLYLDANAFTNFPNCSPGAGGEIDGCLNAANAYALTTGIPLLDARAFNGNQGLLNEVYIGRLAPPIVTACCSGSTLTTGNYKVVYCLSSGTFPTCANNVVSWESVVAITAGQGILVTSPAYSGTATTYTVAVSPVNGASGSELFCTNLANANIGINVTVASLTNCTGTIVKSQNISVSLMPPHYGVWTMLTAGNWCAYGNGTGSCGTAAYTKQGTCGLRFFSQSSYLGDATGEGRSFQVTSSGGGITALATICTDTNTISATQPDGSPGLSFNGYYRLEGLSGVTTAGDTFSTAIYIFGLVDTSVVAYAHGGVHQAIPVALIQNTCCGTNFKHLQLEGNGFASPAVLQVGGFTLANGSPTSSVTEFTCDSCSIVHPSSSACSAASCPSIRFDWFDSATTFSGTTYLEVNDSANACSDQIILASQANETGSIKFETVRIGGSISVAHATGCSAFQISNAHTQKGLTVGQIVMGNFESPYNYLANTAFNVALTGSQQTFPGFTVTSSSNPVVILGDLALSHRLSQLVANTFAGSGTSPLTVTFPLPAYNSTPACTFSDVSATPAIIAISAFSNAGFTATGTAGHTLDWICVGNPN